ncbi:FCD domain-containing protein, partial [bacterium]|nr:FCD domain-containing protein [bacterium]
LMEYFELNQAIHQRLVDAAGNRALSRIYAAECARIRRYRFAGNRRHERWDRAVAEHDQILGFLGCLVLFPGMHPGTLIADVGHFKEIAVQPAGFQGFHEHLLVGFGTARGHDHA